MDKDTFLAHEGKLAKFFLNSRRQNRLSHAYLLTGEGGAPLKDVALFLAKSLSCQEGLLACGQCSSCQRFEKGIHPDFRLIDGSGPTIRKETVKQLLEDFSLSALEKGHVLCYVVHEVDNITEEAANALLKFLEEPREGQVAFLTTYNPTRVLKTIRSRTILLSVEPMDSTSFYRQLLSEPFSDGKGKEIPLSDGALFFLSRSFTSRSEIQAMLQEDDSFALGYEAAEIFLTELSRSPKGAGIALLECTQRIKDAKCYNWMYRTLLCVFQESLFQGDTSQSPFREITRSLARHPRAIMGGIAILQKALRLRQINLSPTALCARLVRTISEEY